MTAKINYWCFVILMTGCNAHMIELNGQPDLSTFFEIETHQTLSQELDQMLQIRIDNLVANPVTDTSSNTDLFISGDQTIIESEKMVEVNIHQFTTDGQIQLSCFGTECDGVQFSGRVVIDIDHYIEHVSINNILLTDDKNMYTVRGNINKAFRDIDTILNPANIDIILTSPNIDLKLDTLGVLGIYDLPEYNHAPLTAHVELSHEMTQTYLIGQVVSIHD